MGVAVAASGGFRGDSLLREGQSLANVAAAYDDVELSRGTSAADLVPFLVRLDDVRPTFSADGAPTAFAADLAVADGPGAESRPAEVSVNNPVSVGGTEVYLQNVGYSVRLRVTDGEGRVSDVEQQCLPVSPTYQSSCTVKLPDAEPAQLAFSAQLVPTAGADAEGRLASVHPEPRDPRLVLMPLAGDLGLDTGQGQNIYALPDERLVPPEERQDGCDAVAAADAGQLCALPPEDGEPATLAVGDVLDLPQELGSVEFVGVGEWGRLTVVDEPGQGTLLVATVVLLGGLVLSLRGRRRRLWVRVTPRGDGGSDVAVGALARSDADDAAPDVAELLDALAGTPAPAAPTSPLRPTPAGSRP